MRAEGLAARAREILPVTSMHALQAAAHCVTVPLGDRSYDILIGEGRTQQLQYVIDRTDAEIADLETKRAQIDATLAELRVINTSCRGHLAERERTGKKQAK